MRVEIKCQECGNESLEITDYDYDGNTISIKSLPKCQQTIDKDSLFEDWYKNIYPKAKGRSFKKGQAKKKFNTRIKSKKEYSRLLEGTEIYRKDESKKGFQFVIEPYKFLDGKEYLHLIEREQEKKDNKMLDKHDQIGYNDVYITKDGEGKYLCDECGKPFNIRNKVDGRDICQECSLII